MLSAMNPNPRMTEMINPIELNGGQGAERLCERFGISRREMDEWALRSHRRAVAAQEAGRFAEEIVPWREYPDGERRRIDHDQGPRPDTTLEKIASLLPMYRPDGRITAATASGQADGAAVCMVMSRAEAARARRSPRWPRIHTIATGACGPRDLIYSAIPATHRALERSGLRMRDIEVIEINEAFACAPIALMREFKMADARRGEDQRQRRRLRPRPSGRRLGRAAGRHVGDGDAPAPGAAMVWPRSAGAWAKERRRFSNGSSAGATHRPRRTAPRRTLTLARRCGGVLCGRGNGRHGCGCGGSRRAAQRASAKRSPRCAHPPAGGRVFVASTSSAA